MIKESWKIPMREISAPIAFDATFRLWLYTVSHGQLLFRSTDAEPGRNTDIVFMGVQHLKVGSTYDGLLLRESGEDHEARRAGAAGQTGLVVLLDTPGNDYVVCKAFRISTNTLGRFQVDFPVLFREAES
jgi:hypothetical protein